MTANKRRDRMIGRGVDATTSHPAKKKEEGEAARSKTTADKRQDRMIVRGVDATTSHLAKKKEVGEAAGSKTTADKRRDRMRGRTKKRRRRPRQGG
jgi:hypothetical protein